MARKPVTIARVQRALAASLFVAIAAFGTARPAFAQTPEASAAATELFNAGRDLIAHGDYAAACPKLAESARLDAKVGTLARLAECEENRGHLAAARADWERAQRLAKDTRDPRIRAVSTELARVEKRVPKLVVIVPSPSPERLTVLIDHAPVAADDLGAPLPVDPGDHVVEARAPGYRPWTSTITTRADGAVSAARVELAPSPGTRDPGARPRASATRRPVQAPYRIGGFVTVGVGGAVVLAGAALGIAAISKNASSNRHGCDELTDICDQPGLDERRSARSLGTASSWLFVGGAALIGAGFGMMVFGPRDFEAPAATARSHEHPWLSSPALSPMISPNTAGISLRSRW